MPQLPSGLRVGLSIEHALENAREGSLGFRIQFHIHIRSAEDIAPVVSIIYFRPKEGVPEPGEASLSGMTLDDIGTDRCDWSKEDVAFFNEWLATEQAQKWKLERYNELVETLENSQCKVPENLKGIFDADDDFSVTPFNNGRREEELPDAVINTIGELIKRDNVQSVSFPFNNTKVWRLLVAEQLHRAEITGLPKEKAFALSGPDGGLSCNPPEWGGDVHIPYEGCCMGDLFIAPGWRNLLRETNSATLSSSYHYLLVQRELGELDCSIRHKIGDGWFLYESTRPYVRHE